MKRSVKITLASITFLCAIGFLWPRANTATTPEEDITEIEVPNIHIKKYGGHVDSKDGTYLECNMKVEGCSQETTTKLFEQLEIEVLKKRALSEEGVAIIKGEPPFDSLSIVGRHIRIAWNKKSDIAHYKVERVTKEIFFKD